MGLIAELPEITLLLAAVVAICAGFVKGVVGFGMPLLMISGLASLLPAEIALAALIVPTVVTNGYQALRQGWVAARRTITRYRVFLLSMTLFIALSAQLVAVLPETTFFIVLGVPIVAFCIFQLSGWVPRLKPENQSRDEAVVGAVAGISGGLSGVWGPPTILYLTAINTPKLEQMRVQGVIYGMGAVVLVVAHLRSGIFNAETAPLSALLLVPALTGMFLGGLVNDKLPQSTFTRVTLIVLTVAGLNLIRKGLWG
ncbi:sulfite exporter TauE/SafE family protein [Aliiroseovarius sp. 2305UL8-7]|uniref:sulfite exporter TauE/SafE family protein n=1 Tax=Aliiroseovarius conchicola TaxID=3121637 RepID=UPI00352969F3